MMDQVQRNGNTECNASLLEPSRIIKPTGCHMLKQLGVIMHPTDQCTPGEGSHGLLSMCAQVEQTIKEDHKLACTCY